MKNITQPVVVFGVSHPTTLQVIRSIGRQSVNVFLVTIGDFRYDILHYSKYVEEYVSFTSNEEGVNFLLTANCTTDKPLILVSGDDAALAIDAQKEMLSIKYHVPGSNKYSLDYLMRKLVMNEMASSVGLKVPKSLVLQRGDICNLSYPILVKPSMSVEGSKSDIKICKTEDDLLNYWKLSNLQTVLATEFIEKDYEVCILCSKLRNMPAFITGVVQKIRHMPLIYGARSYAKIQKCDSLPNIPYSNICKLIDNTGYIGLLSIELLIKGDEAWFVELNYRADGNMMAYTDAGCNLPYNCYVDCKESPILLEKVKNNISNEVYIMTEGDFYHVTKYHDITLFEWLKDFKKASSFIVFDRYDIKPFLMHKFIDYKRRISRCLKR